MQVKSYYLRLASQLDEIREVIYDGQLDQTVLDTMTREDKNKDGFIDEDEFYKRYKKTRNTKEQKYTKSKKTEL